MEVTNIQKRAEEQALKRIPEMTKFIDSLPDEQKNFIYGMVKLAYLLTVMPLPNEKKHKRGRKN